MRLFPASGEINRRLADPVTVLTRIEKHFESAALVIDRTDGLSMDFTDWRFNLRCSNTEPVVRLNVETRGDESLMRERTAEILRLMEGRAARPFCRNPYRKQDKSIRNHSSRRQGGDRLLP
jgi:phosphomannomutase